MKFKIDENLPAECASLLQVAGFEAATVGDEQLSGADDSKIFDRCRTESRVLITLDLDFANVQTYTPGSHTGIVVFRSRSQDKSALISLMKRLLPVFAERFPEGQLWIVGPDRIRYREK